MNIILVNLMHDRADYNQIIVIIHKTYVMSKEIFSSSMFYRRCNLSIELTHVNVCMFRESVSYIFNMNMFLFLPFLKKERFNFFARFVIIVAWKLFAVSCLNKSKFSLCSVFLRFFFTLKIRKMASDRKIFYFQ